MIEVGVYEAKTRLPGLLDRVARGERVTITRHGVPVAMLVPIASAQKRPVDEAIAELRSFGRGRRLGMSIRATIQQGRR
jgi:prevent-host-death family protein